ncbi:MAG: peptide ABC transporter substrate-binding protein, partial [Chloroflexi bacterium]|nr:peptide ABC transporter substrate-binding protein [Chloroflexota bacterium]
MLSKKRFYWVVAIVIAVATVLSGCAGGKAGGKVLRVNLGTEPPTLDPALTTDTTSVQCVEVLFLGLTDFDDKTVEVIPELA